MENERVQLKARKLWMEKLTDKGKHKVKVGNPPKRTIVSKLEIMRRGMFKYKLLEIH